MSTHRLVRRSLAVAVVTAAAALALAAPPASAATGQGASAHVSTRVDDPTDALRRVGNVHIVEVGVDINPEGLQVAGEVTSYNCEPGQPLGECDRAALNRLVSAGPATVKVHADGSAMVTATVAEERERDGRRLRVFDVNLTIGSGTLELRQDCNCGFTRSDGISFNQRKFVKQWNGNTASGSIGVYPVTAGAATTAGTSKYWVKSSIQA